MLSPPWTCAFLVESSTLKSRTHHNCFTLSYFCYRKKKRLPTAHFSCLRVAVTGNIHPCPRVYRVIPSRAAGTPPKKRNCIPHATILLLHSTCRYVGNWNVVLLEDEARWADDSGPLCRCSGWSQGFGQNNFLIVSSHDQMQDMMRMMRNRWGRACLSSACLNVSASSITPMLFEV